MQRRASGDSSQCVSRCLFKQSVKRRKVQYQSRKRTAIRQFGPFSFGSLDGDRHFLQFRCQHGIVSSERHFILRILPFSAAVWGVKLPQKSQQKPYHARIEQIHHSSTVLPTSRSHVRSSSPSSNCTLRRNSKNDFFFGATGRKRTPRQPASPPSKSSICFFRIYAMATL